MAHDPPVGSWAMSRKLGLCLVAALVVTAACSGGDDDDSSDDTKPPSSMTTVPPAVTADDLCKGPLTLDGDATVANAELKEVSGVVVSRRNASVLWAHNDSGAGPDVYALGEAGTNLGRYRLQGGATAIDWEDMALGRGPEDGVDYLYLGDIGDNAGKRADIRVYRAPEPAVTAAGPATDGTIADVERLTLTYADGPHDAETLLADPVTGDLFVVTKQWDGKASGVYRIPADASPSAPVAMERVGEVPAVEGQLATGGDVSVDGSMVVLRTYGKVLVFGRPEGQTVAEALAGEPCEAQAPAETQGEAIAFAPGGRGYVTIAEAEKPHVNWLRLG